MQPCTVENCGRPRVGWGYCSRHWQQWRRLGEVKTSHARTASPIIERDGYLEVGLLDRFDNIVTWTLISKEDRGLVEGKKLRTDKGRYAAFFGGQTVHYLHRAIHPTSLVVDHANGNGLDNRRENLRPTTHQLNCANKPKATTKGVRRRGRKFEAYMTTHEQGKRRWRYLGLYNTKHEAAEAYNRAATETWGEFAALNALDDL